MWHSAGTANARDQSETNRLSVPDRPRSSSGSHAIPTRPGRGPDRVPFADIGPLKIDSDLSDDQVLFLSDILPTGHMGAEMCDIRPGDTVAVWGCGPVGLFAI